jgi:ferric-dicitrate binding protein FerR (iron transport regulator)
MEMQNIPWEAISAKLKNVAGDEEIRQIQEWLDLSQDNPKILSEILNTWAVTRGKPEFYQPDMTYNWNKLIDKISRRSERKNSTSIFLKIAAAAAVLVVVFLAGFALSQRLKTGIQPVFYSKVIAPKGNKTQIVLPDSSKVWLNSGAELWYPSDFSSDNREVWMKGECFFEVRKDPDHPLVVHGTKLHVKVFGTSFNLKEDETKDVANISLISGKVEVLDLQDRPISALAPGEQFVFCNGVGKVQVADNLEALTSWVNNILIFNNQPFGEVVSYLNGWYGVNIRYDHALYSRHKYTFKVKTESLREVLELITIITPISYDIEGDQVTIKYKQKM